MKQSFILSLIYGYAVVAQDVFATTDWNNDNYNRTQTSSSSSPLRVHSPNPIPYQVTYDDGTKSPQIKLKLRGDLHLQSHDIYEETEDGYTVTVGRNGRYVYVDFDEETGELVKTKFVATEGKRFHLKNVTPHAFQKRQKALKITKDSSMLDQINSNNQRRNLSAGTVQNLVVLFKFKDHNSRKLPSRDDIETLMNGDDDTCTPNNPLCPTGSVRGYFLKNSFDKFDQRSTVLEWVTISQTEAECANKESGQHRRFLSCLREALDMIESRVDFLAFDTNRDKMIDGMTFLHSGYAADQGGIDEDNTPIEDRIWSHQWAIYDQTWFSSSRVQVYSYHISSALWGTSGSSIGHIGVIAHETGHFLGLPDFYDKGDEEYGEGEGLGSYCLMANSWGVTNNQLNPPHVSMP